MKILKPFAILMVFVLLCAVHLTISTSSMNTSYEIDELKQKFEKVRSENRYLNYLVAKEESLPRIEKLAKGKLNMVYPEKVNYMIVSTSESKGSH